MNKPGLLFLCLRAISGYRRGAEIKRSQKPELNRSQKPELNRIHCHSERSEESICYCVDDYV